MRQAHVYDMDETGLDFPDGKNRKERRAARKRGKGATDRLAMGDGADVGPKSAHLFDLATECHRTGQMAEAERLCRQLLALDPGHADSLHLLGVIAAQSDRYELAFDLIGQAIRLHDDVPFYHIDLGYVLTALGRLDDAVTSYQRALAIAPDLADVHYNLGLILKSQGRLDDAVASCRRALAIKPDFAEAYFNLGLALREQGKLDDAVASYQRALAINPDFADAHHNLGGALQDQGRLDDAVACYRRALILDPDSAITHYNLANALEGQGRFDDAVASYRRTLALQPDFADAHNNLGTVLQAHGRYDEAAASYARALAVKPDYAEAHNNLGNLFLYQGKTDEAVACYEHALSIRSDYPEAHSNLGNAFQAQGRLEDAIASHERALALRPDRAEAHNNLGNVLIEQGRPEDAAARYARAVAIKPDYAAARSNLVMCMNYTSNQPVGRIDAETRRWNEIHALPHHPIGYEYGNDRKPDRRLRIGYVSPDFRRHSVSYFFEPLLRAHDRAAVEIFCYAEVPTPDAVTDRLRALADCWRVTVGMSDDDVARQIREDRIDILVDLAGHTANSRLPVFARKPAPVQVTWLGYPNSTGLTAIDYRLVDAVTDPMSDAKAWASERLVRLPDGFLCYQPRADAPALLPPPSLGSDVITFGSFNNLAKLSGETLDAWAALLRRLPKAQILLQRPAFTDAATRALFHARFAERGVAPERVILLGLEPDIVDHLAVYNRVDIALDSFPYNGTTTTCEALWMGVPVVTLRGRRHAGRVGASLLGRLGLDDLIAEKVEAYIEIAATLAADRARLVRLRQDLRASFAASSLCDGPAFARKVEAAYRGMWQRWCQRPSTEPDSSDDASSTAAANGRQELSLIPGSQPLRARIAEQVAAVPYWYHRIELPEGIITPGWAPLDPAAYQIPTRLDGKRVLDVGAWDGYWSFEALKRGAREVVAIDDFSDYMGNLDKSDRTAWKNFDLCRSLLGYDERRCQRIDMTVYDIREERLGRFDVIFFFGTLYHLRHPLLALDRLAAICDGEIFVESAVLDDFSPYRGGLGHGYAGGQAVMEFYPGDEYGGNHTNWWTPTVRCMVGLLEAAGFGDCRGWKLTDQPTALRYCRGFAHGRKIAGHAR